MNDRGRCLASQEIRRLIESGSLVSELDEDRIQPSSFEPTIGNEAFILDTREGLFRPTEDRTVYRTLLELPQRRRTEVDISDGFEIKPGFSYLFPLNETICGNSGFRFVESSPKSSVGRLFPRSRLFTDFNCSFDEITNLPKGRDLKPWLLVQPQNFSLVVGPGMSFNQLRFFSGYNSQLTPGEIIAEWRKQPLLFGKDLEGKLGDPEEDPRLAEALQLHLDLEGRSSEGIVALRARKNPHPIDLRKEEELLAEDYFEPMKAKDGMLTLEVGDHYLLASKEVLRIPKDRCAVIRAHSHQGLLGALHEAGFIDNGFTGDLVLEVTPEERTNVDLADGMPIGELLVYRTEKPDKLYGKKIGSHYNGQLGPKVPKFFQGFDYEIAAKNHARLDRIVLVQDRRKIEVVHDSPDPFVFREREEQEGIVKVAEQGLFHSRYDCEDDDLVVQPIPYVVIFDDKGKVFSYVRSKDIKDYGDVRLHGKHSIGVGGHIIRADAPDFIANGLERELGEEVTCQGRMSLPKFVGTIYCQDKEVDRFHFGLVYGVHASGTVKRRDREIASGRMLSFGEIRQDPKKDQKYETWSRVLIPHLEEIRDRSAA